MKTQVPLSEEASPVNPSAIAAIVKEDPRLIDLTATFAAIEDAAVAPTWETNAIVISRVKNATDKKPTDCVAFEIIEQIRSGWGEPAPANTPYPKRVLARNGRNKR